MLVNVLLLALATLATLAAAQTDYCQVCADHTLCLYNSVSSTCNIYTRNQPTASDRATILRSHNTLRNRVALGLELRGNPGPQPSASNMQKLVWSEEIATIAQAWADQCTFQNDACRNTNGTYVGQNLYLESSSGTLAAINWDRAVQSWYEEVTDRNRANNSPFTFTAATGHYTQLVWATTSEVGCGSGDFTRDGFNSRIFVCNYRAGGNIIGASMYEGGLPASNCPTGKFIDLLNLNLGLCA